MSLPPFLKSRPHPWHGLSAGPNVPELVNAFIEITPFDLIKYEVDKESGYLKVDRPQRTSSTPPMLYGFIPQTYCGENVSKLSPNSKSGDGDPLDICVISERPVTKSEVILRAKVVGGLKMLDGGQADDKIVAVLEHDPVWGELSELEALPAAFMERLTHYFLTYKIVPGSPNRVVIDGKYDCAHAYAVIEASMKDYQEAFREVV